MKLILFTERVHITLVQLCEFSQTEHIPCEQHPAAPLVHCAGVPQTAPQLDGAPGGAGALHAARSGPARVHASGRLRSQVSQGTGAQSGVRRTPRAQLPSALALDTLRSSRALWPRVRDSSPAGCWRWRKRPRPAHTDLQTPGATSRCSARPRCWHKRLRQREPLLPQGMTRSQVRAPRRQPGPPLHTGLAERRGLRPAVNTLRQGSLLGPWPRLPDTKIIIKGPGSSQLK